MLEGVEVLNQTEIITKSGNTDIAIVAAILFVIAIICTLSFFNEDMYFVGYMFLFIGIISGITLVCNIKNIKETPTGEYEYQVIIDDSVKLNDFYEKYEIINVNGKIYTIREK